MYYHPSTIYTWRHYLRKTSTTDITLNSGKSYPSFKAQFNSHLSHKVFPIISSIYTPSNHNQSKCTPIGTYCMSSLGLVSGTLIVSYHFLHSVFNQSFPGGTSGKESTCQCRRRLGLQFHPWVRKIPSSRKWQPAPVLLPGKPHRQRSLAGYSPQCCKQTWVSEHSRAKLSRTGSKILMVWNGDQSYV